MFYRIRVDLAYPEDTNPKAILAKAKDLLYTSVIINPGQINEERGYITLEKCYHDDDPTKPCEVIQQYYTD